ncbi:hypothetical protein O181_008439 [Austropuccinia psidii MF-1]|uniref:WLM domain-containing protein n=1 Tax=Austropuccinia psidii MF-1 TaxID=1389203 RepID=A0A9Q3BNV4_9BASI|nr:hypothetical protein [Austropuccinia psidii MF-1]
MHRFNGSEYDHPNPSINFIRVLGDNPQDKSFKTAQNDGKSHDTEAARLIMRAIAAQVRPIMKSHGMGLNSFNEYRWNSEFAGRNWNGGEIIELVLRRRDGRFLPMGYLLSVMAHELAHIHHMNHGPQFQKLNRQIRQEIEDLQRKGYYGPGFWSSGQRLKDSAISAGEGVLTASDLPEYTCGGSLKQGTRRRIYRPRTGARKKRSDRFVGEGQKLDSASNHSSFRKRANAAAAKNARALAAEQRLQKAKSIKTPDADAKPNGIGPIVSAGSSRDSKNDTRNNEVLLLSEDSDTEIIGLEAEWQDFEPQPLNTTEVDREIEQIALRNEMQELLTQFQSPQTAKSCVQPLAILKSPDNNKETVIADAVDSASALDNSAIHKRKLQTNYHEGPRKATKCIEETQTSHSPSSSTTQRSFTTTSSFPPQRKAKEISSPLSQAKSTSSLTCSNPLLKPSPDGLSTCRSYWSCLTCYEVNHVDLAICGSCLRPKGTPAPKWD